MSDMKDTVHVTVEHYSGQDEGDDGAPYYVASCEELMFTTDGETFEELLKNVRECLALSLEGVDTVVEYGVVPNPRVKIIMELPENYAETA